MSDLSILIVTSSPDERDTTAELTTIVTELRRRPGVSVDVWFLRHGDDPPWPGSRVVDDLRTAPVPRALDAIRIAPAAGVVRGRVLRRWWAETAPDVVVLDDGLGDRLLPADRSGLVVVHRLNEVPSAHARLEAPGTSTPDIQLVPTGMEPPVGTVAPTVLATTSRSDHEPVRPFVDAASRSIVRKRLGLPVDGPLVVGWGEHAWFDGPDMLVRTIWNLRERHGVDAHGMWAGGDEGGEVAALVADEASRCGMADHVSHQPRSTIDVRLCGDVVLLPYRDAGDLWSVHQAAVAGCEVVTFPVWGATDPAFRTVGHLDLEAAAAAIVESLSGDRARRAVAARARLDVGSLVDELLDAVAAARRSR